MSNSEEIAAKERFERGVSSFLRDKWEGNKDIQKSCELLSGTSPDETLTHIITATRQAQEKWKDGWRFCMADSPSGLANALCSVAPRCADCRAAVQYLKELAGFMESAVVALGFSKDETVIDWLTQHKVSGDDYNFPTKFTAIGRIGGPKAANFLVSHIGNPKVLTMFREIGIDAIPALANALDAGELLAWLPLKTLGWRPQTLNQRICVAILEQDRGLLEAVTVQHFDQVAKCFDAAYGSSKIDREHWDRVGAKTEALAQFRDQWATDILRNADGATLRRFMDQESHFPCWRARAAAQASAHFGGPQDLSEFVEVCERSGKFLVEMITLADRFPREAEAIFVRLAKNVAATNVTRMSAATWLLSRDNPEAYRIIPALTLEIVSREKKFPFEGKLKEWSEATGISEELLTFAEEALSPVTGRYDDCIEKRTKCEEATQKLCSIKNPLSSAVLKGIRSRPDGEWAQWAETYKVAGGTLDLSNQRALAEAEMEARQLEPESLEKWYRCHYALCAKAGGCVVVGAKKEEVRHGRLG